MTDSALETVLRRDRIIVAGALGIIVALAWGYVLWLAIAHRRNDRSWR
jgi:predicted metal-binding membrane protein